MAAKTTSNFLLLITGVWNALPLNTIAFSGENSKDIFYKFGNVQTSGHKLDGMVMCSSGDEIWVMTTSSAPTTLTIVAE